MKFVQTSNRQKALTIIEVLVVVAVLALLVGMISPLVPRKSKARATRVQCISNLKSVGLALRLYANERGNWLEIKTNAGAWEWYQAIGPEIGSPKILLCPMDKERKKPSLNFETNWTSDSFAHPQARDKALSYLFGIDSEPTQANMILAGDRNVTTNQAIMAGLLNVKTNSPLSWTDDIHKQSGNIALVDGSAHPVTSAKLKMQVSLGFSTNGLQRYAIP